MGILKRLFRPKAYEEEIAEKIIDIAKAGLWDIGGFGSSAILASILGPSYGVVGYDGDINVKQLIRAYKRIPKLHSSVHKIATSISATAWYMYKKSRDSKAMPIPTRAKYSGYKYREKFKAEIKANNEYEEIESHPMIELLYRGNPVLNGNECFQLLETYLELKGDGIILLDRGKANGAGLPMYWWVIHPGWVQERATQEKPEYKIEMNGKIAKYPANDVIWIRDPDPENPYENGCGFGQTLADEIDADDNAIKMIKHRFYNHGRPDGIIKVAGASEDLCEAWKAKWNQKLKGPANAGKILFTGKDIDWKEINQKFQDMQLLDLRKDIRDTFGYTFGIPPEIQGIVENSNRATIDGSEFIYTKYVLVPRLERIRVELQRNLVAQYDDKIIFDYENPIPDDKNRELEAAKAAPWAFTINQWSEMGGYKGFQDNGEYRMVPAGLNPQPAYEPPKEPVNPTPENNPKPHDDEEKDKAEKKTVVVKVITPEEISNINAVVDSLDPQRLIKETEPVWDRHMEEWGNNIMSTIGVETSFDILNPFVTEHMLQFQNDRIKGLVNQTTRRRMRESLVEGIQKGEGIKQLRERVHDVFLEGDMDIYKVRATRIARTETMRSANFGGWNAMKQSNVIEQKQWIASFKDTRQAHAAAHLQVKNMDEKFVVGGELGMFPGDFESAWNVVNCMCTVVAVIDNKPIEPKNMPLDGIEHKAYWDDFEKSIKPWTSAAQKALIVGFEKQLIDSLNEFDRVF